MKLNKKTREEKGITLVGLIILLAIIAFLVVIMKWAIGFSSVVKEKTKQHETIIITDMSSYSSTR